MTTIAMVVSLGLASAAAMSAGAAGGESPAVSTVGMTKRKLAPSGDFDWRGSSQRKLDVTVWYPAAAHAKEAPIDVPSPEPLWHAGMAAVDAPLAPRKQKYPLVVLSHGTGGAAAQLAWLGTALARGGFIAAAVNHPGNSYEDTSTFEGFILRWLRARDLSLVIDGVLSDPTLGGFIDCNRIGAAGFSLGGFTVMTIAGARSDLAGFQQYCSTHATACTPPPDFPDLERRIASKARTDPRFRAALDHAGDSYRDERVRAVLAIAPPLAHSVSPASLEAISIPVRLIVGDSDRAAPAENAHYYARHVANARLDVLPGGIGHFVFLDLPTEKGKSLLPSLAVDPPGVDRGAIHKAVAAMATAFFTEALK